MFHILGEYRKDMSRTVDHLAKEALQLPSALRAELADRLVESLESAPSDEIQKTWTREALKRRDEVRSGKVQTIPGDQVLAEARRALKR